MATVLAVIALVALLIGLTLLRIRGTGCSPNADMLITVYSTCFYDGHGAECGSPPRNSRPTKPDDFSSTA